ncbi:type III secretion outer membrane pore, YscC/HrcC family [Providencia rettgeri DSM 1131]|uniref:type III secretion system outer membrane ring subunit SctC n=1 Tax=Providencia TaxID=586 RepID=UPI000197BD38|nr:MULTISPECIES: type III secretion system outer membrane ring subunit SctC [Providencia]EFE52622.1 type III secretion outer membrane pore, YscC/HrcC family [Providencia rettgeri DSM 1131]MBI6189726.1 type III secretion system outer membrane ring subunit SctC [Providencia rettgeri]QKG43197.1 type III secretion system outer membrane ring subunit SctC [Providencia rettgeri]QNN33323.1 type III secretion system outer membrane ring subunit SctC [Providencia rettgeri]QXA58174.1 type III secretion sy
MSSKKNRVFGLTLFLLSMSFYSAQAEIIVAEPVTQSKNHDTFVANNIAVGKVFDAVAERLNKPIILSKLAAQKKVTGNFNLAHADEMFKALSRRIALVWYDDGASIYVYDNSEMRSEIIPTNNVSSNQLLNYIQRNGIYDSRFPVRSQEGERLLFVSGPPLYIELIKAASLYLAEQIRKEELSSGEVAIIPLKHASVTDRSYSLRGQNITIPGLLNVINNLFKNGTTIDETLIIQPPSVAINSTGDSIDELMDAPIGDSSSSTIKPQLITRKPSNSAFSLVAHPDSNSLIVKGSQEQIRYVRQLVNTLDMRRRQVELSLWIIDITRSELDNLGVNWEVGTFNTGTGSVSFNRSTLSNSQQFLLQIDALNKTGNGHIVSRPVLLTQENIPALFDNNTSFYAKLQGERIATLEQVTYGTMVSVMPRISAGNNVEMEVNIEDGAENRDSMGKTSSVEGLPAVNRTSINTVARIAKDSSLLIGGYTREQYVENESKIPFLGDLPYVGGLFSHSSMNQQKMVRLFLIQPRLLDENEGWDGRQFSEKTRITNHDSQLHGTVQFLQQYMSESWQ